MDVSKNLHHEDDGQALLPLQYQTKANVSNVLSTLMARVQEVEGVLYDVWFYLLLDNARGDQLDLWGRFLRAPRGGWSDEEYRSWLRTRIRVYISKGRTPDVIAIARLALGDSDLSYLEPPAPDACFEVTKDGAIPSHVQPAATALGEGKPVGVRGLFTYSVLATDTTLHWGYPSQDLSPKQTHWAGDPYTTSIASSWAGAQKV